MIVKKMQVPHTDFTRGIEKQPSLCYNGRITHYFGGAYAKLKEKCAPALRGQT